MIVNILATDGNGSFTETSWTKPEPASNEIEVKTIMTGVCRSDIDMMSGKFDLLPINMSGHEGLGKVTRIGSDITNIKVGDIVATRGEPAYADYYNVRHNEYVKVPEAHPRYIIEPVACGLNVINQARDQIEKKRGGKVLIIGSGFLAWVAYTELSKRGYYNFDIDVVGRSNTDLWGDVLKARPEGEYDIVIDLGSGTEIFDLPIVKNEALIILGVQKSITTDFGNLLWKACTIVFPSPRTKDFYYSMVHAVNVIENGTLNIDKFWSRGYNRETEWQLAFDDAVQRPKGYSRGYIVWQD